MLRLSDKLKTQGATENEPYMSPIMDCTQVPDLYTSYLQYTNTLTASKMH